MALNQGMLLPTFRLGPPIKQGNQGTKLACPYYPHPKGSGPLWKDTGQKEARSIQRSGRTEVKQHLLAMIGLQLWMPAQDQTRSSQPGSQRGETRDM